MSDIYKTKMYYQHKEIINKNLTIINTILYSIKSFCMCDLKQFLMNHSIKASIHMLL